MHLMVEPLEGGTVRLDPVRPDMREAVRQALDVDPDNWNIQFASGRGEGFEAYWQAMLPGAQAGRTAFAVRLVETGEVVGTSSFLHASQANRTVEIGSTFLHPRARGTRVNPEIKLLMLQHAFEAGALRVQLTVDSRNLRSQAAVTKLGAVREGVIRRHLITWTGHHRDSVIFSIIEPEWPGVRERLVSRLGKQG